LSSYNLSTEPAKSDKRHQLEKMITTCNTNLNKTIKRIHTLKMNDEGEIKFNDSSPLIERSYTLKKRLEDARGDLESKKTEKDYKVDDFMDEDEDEDLNPDELKIVKNQVELQLQ